MGGGGGSKVPKPKPMGPRLERNMRVPFSVSVGQKGLLASRRETSTQAESSGPNWLVEGSHGDRWL